MISQKIKKNKGFVILFAVMLSSIILAIALGVTNIALKEIQFATSARDANDAFFAADVGAECALYHDSKSAFGDISGNPTACAGTTFDISAAGPSWSIVIPNLGSTGKACAIVSIVKDSAAIPPNPINTIISKGYSNGSSGIACTPASNAVERELEVTY